MKGILSNEKWCEVGSVKFRLREYTSYVEVWIPGTDSFEKNRDNAFQDLKISLQFWPNKKGFHSGCYKAATAIKEHPEFWGMASMFNVPILIIGYSMGAGVAECLADSYRYPLRLKTYAGYKVSRRTPRCPTERIIKGRDKIRWFCFWNKGKVTGRQDPGSGKWPSRFIYDHTHYSIPEGR